MRLTPYTINESLPIFQIRAAYTDSSIRVYHAYSDDIADAALKAGTFVSPPFSMTRMTWIKPSFLWMMYRSGWAQKDMRQVRVLAIDIGREGFDWALANACLSACPPHMSQEDWRKRKTAMPNVVQWDPEKDIFLQPLPHRSVQIGIGAAAVPAYVQEWIKSVEDVTPLARNIHSLVEKQRIDDAVELLPTERAYPASLADIVPVKLS
ncbi:DUF4291 domain-containing protein [Rhizobium sp.]